MSEGGSLNRLDKLNIEQRFLILIFLLALALRLGYALFFPWDLTGDRFDPGQLFQDERVYDETATNLLDGKGFVSSSDVAVLPPVYPVFLAGVYAVFGHSFTAVRIVQVVISALTCVVVYYLGKGAFNRGVGRLAAVISVCYPFFLVWTRALLTETLTAFLVAVGVLWLQKTACQTSAVNCIVAGCIWGSAALLRGNMALFLPLLLLWALLEFGPTPTALRVGTSTLLTAGLLIAPWAVRNYVQYRELVLVSSHGGLNIYNGNNPYSSPYVPYDSQTVRMEPEVAAWLQGPISIEMDNELLNRALRYIVAHPRTFLWSAYGRLTVFWRPVTLDTVREKLSSDAGYGGFTSLALRLALPFLSVFDGLVLGLAFVGMFLAVHKRRARPLYIALLAFCAMHLVAIVVGNGRFRLPLMPISIVFSGYAVYALISLPSWAIAGQRPAVPRSWIALLLLGVLLVPVGRALGLGSELRPVEGPPYEVEAFEGVVAPSNRSYNEIAAEGWTYRSDPRFSGGHVALTAVAGKAIQQRIDELPPGDHKLYVLVAGDPDRTRARDPVNRLEINLNGVHRILEWSDGDQKWQQLELVFPDVPAGGSLSLRSLSVGGRFIAVDRVGFVEK